MRTQSERMEALAGVIFQLGHSLGDMDFDCDRALAGVVVAVGGGPMPENPEKVGNDFLWSLGNDDRSIHLDGDSGCGRQQERRGEFLRDLRIVLAEYFDRLGPSNVAADAINRLADNLLVTPKQQEAWLTEKAGVCPRLESMRDEESAAELAIPHFLLAACGGEMPENAERTIDLILWLLCTERCKAAKHDVDEYGYSMAEYDAGRRPDKEVIERMHNIEQARLDVFYADLRCALQSYFSRMACLESVPA
jgi:hypothetical protein